MMNKKSTEFYAGKFHFESNASSHLIWTHKRRFIFRWRHSMERKKNQPKPACELTLCTVDSGEQDEENTGPYLNSASTPYQKKNISIKISISFSVSVSLSLLPDIRFGCWECAMQCIGNGQHSATMWISWQWKPKSYSTAYFSLSASNFNVSVLGGY